MRLAIISANNMLSHLHRNQLLKLTIPDITFQLGGYHRIPDPTRAHN